MFACVLSVWACACSAVLWLCICPATACSLTLVAGRLQKAVDLYNSATGEWSTAQLSLGRDAIRATSVGNLALFAGGWSNIGALLSRKGGRIDVLHAC